METTSQTLGILGEELACHYLVSRGYKILLKNYECALGEIDIVAKEKGALIFIEVKTRSSLAIGDPLEAVTFQKRKQIIKTAQYYLKRYGVRDVSCRFDVVSVILEKVGAAPIITVIQNAFGEGE